MFWVCKIVLGSLFEYFSNALSYFLYGSNYKGYIVQLDDYKYLNSTKSIDVGVKPKQDANLNITACDINVGETATVNIVINENVTGKVTIDGDVVSITKGKGTYTISNLTVGNYVVEAIFAGDKYFKADKASVLFNVFDVETPINNTNTSSGNATGNNTNTSGNNSQENNTVIDPVIKASNVKVTYSSGSYYIITVYGSDGKVAKGVNVVIKLNGKTYKTLKTYSNGVVKFKITQAPKTYKLSISALGKTITKTLTVKHLVTLKYASVKRSAKKLVLTATLGKINKKYLKNKQILFKFNGKIYKAKTNSKGVAKVTIKSSDLIKLKVDKKITYQATYLKDTVKKTVKVKK